MFGIQDWEVGVGWEVDDVYVWDRCERVRFGSRESYEEKVGRGEKERERREREGERGRE